MGEPDTLTGEEAPAASRRILLVEEIPLFAAGLRNILASLGTPAKIVESHDLTTAQLEVARGQPFDLILLSATANGGLSMASLDAFKRRIPDVPLIVMALDGGVEEVLAALRHGAAGYLYKRSRAEVIRLAVSLVLAGERYIPGDTFESVERKLMSVAMNPAGMQMPSNGRLTPREREVVQLLVKGLTNKEIGRQLSTSEVTVKSHVKSSMRKLGVRNRIQLVNAAARIENADRIGVGAAEK